MGREIRYSVKPRSDPGPANVRSVVVGAAALGHTFLRVLRFYPIGIIPLILHTNIIPIKRASWRSVEPPNSPMFFFFEYPKLDRRGLPRSVFRVLDLSYFGSKLLEVKPFNTIFDATTSGECN